MSIISGALLRVFVICLALITVSRSAEAKWIWAQQQNFKSLEKERINSDLYLSRFQSASEQAVRHEDLARTFYGSNFREFVFEVPDNIAEQDVVDIIERVLSRIGEQFSRISPRGPHDLSWGHWLKNGSEIGIGETPRQAFVNLKLKSFKMTYSTWKSRALELRNQLLAISSEYALPWNDFLDASRRYGREPQAMSTWLAQRGLSSSVGPLLSEYGKLLTLSDYLDPHNYRSSESAVRKLNDNIEWDRLLVIDIRQLGTTNRISQDQWLQDGADIEKIEEATRNGTLRLSEIRTRIRILLAALPFGALRAFYELGDSVVIGLRSDYNSDIIPLFEKIKLDPDLHSVVIERRSDSLRQTLDHALMQLKSSPLPPGPGACREIFF